MKQYHKPTARERVNDLRRDYMEACSRYLAKIFMASLDGDEQTHTHLMEELETALTLLYRFDRKLGDINTLEELFACISNDSLAGPSS